MYISAEQLRVTEKSFYGPPFLRDCISRVEEGVSASGLLKGADILQGGG